MLVFELGTRERKDVNLDWDGADAEPAEPPKMDVEADEVTGRKQMNVGLVAELWGRNVSFVTNVD